MCRAMARIILRIIRPSRLRLRMRWMTGCAQPVARVGGELAAFDPRCHEPARYGADDRAGALPAEHRPSPQRQGTLQTGQSWLEPAVREEAAALVEQAHERVQIGVVGRAEP